MDFFIKLNLTLSEASHLYDNLIRMNQNINNREKELQQHNDAHSHSICASLLLQSSFS